MAKTKKLLIVCAGGGFCWFINYYFVCARPKKSEHDKRDWPKFRVNKRPLCTHKFACLLACCCFFLWQQLNTQKYVTADCWLRQRFFCWMMLVIQYKWRHEGYKMKLSKVLGIFEIKISTEYSYSNSLKMQIYNIVQFWIFQILIKFHFALKM